jgi:hypothetical protein
LYLSDVGAFGLGAWKIQLNNLLLISIFLNVKNVSGNYIQYHILLYYSLLVFMAYNKR